MALASISAARSAAVVSVVKNGLPGAAGEDDHAALLQVADGAAADVGLGDPGHLHRGLHARGLPDALEGVLERKAVHDRGDHAHVVGLGPVHAGAGTLLTPPEVAAADDDRHVDAEVVAELGDLLGQLIEHGGVQPEAARFGQRLPGQLQHHTLPARHRRGLDPSSHPT